MINIEFITQQEELNHCIQRLSNVTELVIDLEFDKNHFRYGFNLCLMQIFAEDYCYLIDPLSPNLDIKTIFPILEDSSKEKIVFSFGEDMRLLHSLGCFPKNIFDTAVVARLLNYPPSSLGNTLALHLGLTVNKSAQASDWFARPLTEKQKDYAAIDVLHLIDLKKILVAEAQKLGRMDWVAQENAIWDGLDYSNIDNNIYLRAKDKRRLTAYEWHIFSKIMTLREAKAAELNRPSYKVLDKDYLLEMAQRPSQINRFNKIRNIHKSLRNITFEEELRAVLEAAVEEAEKLGLSKEERADKHRMNEEEYQKMKAAKRTQEEAKLSTFKPIQKQIVEQLGEHIVTHLLNNRLMEELALGKTSNLLPYRRQIIEQYAEELGLNLRQYFE